MSLICVANVTARKVREYALELINSDIESALLVAECYGAYLARNYIGIYADVEFEDLLAQRLLYLADGLVKEAGFKTLHLMTTPYVSGGHTRVVEKLLIGGLGDGLASLDRIPAQVFKKIPPSINIYDGIRQQSGVATIKRILQVGLQYENVILHIHQDDIYSATAAILLAKLGVGIFFYNHADHSFSFGYAGAKKVLEISKFGWEKGVLRGVECKQSFVGIPIAVSAVRQNTNDDHILMHGFIAGNPYKFNPWGEYSMPAFLNQLFQNNEKFEGIEFLICGPTGREKYWRSLSNAARDHVRFFGQMPHADYLELLTTADFYLDSFPVGNGTGIVEPVMLGIPVFGLNLSAGYSVADVLQSHSLSDLKDKLYCFLANKQASCDRVLDVREQVICGQSVEVCIKRIRYVMNGELNIPLLSVLDSLKPMGDFFEKYWETEQRIFLDIHMLYTLSPSQIFRFLRCCTDAWPYCSILSVIRQFAGLIKRAIFVKLSKMTVRKVI